MVWSGLVRYTFASLGLPFVKKHNAKATGARVKLEHWVSDRYGSTGKNAPLALLSHDSTFYFLPLLHMWFICFSLIRGIISNITKPFTQPFFPVSVIPFYLSHL